jgi:DCN1-like protein 1/2
MAPAPSSTQQKGLVAEFTAVTNADKTTAAKILKQQNWNLTTALNA